jgi:hypothetical protein
MAGALTRRNVFEQAAEPLRAKTTVLIGTDISISALAPRAGAQATPWHGCWLLK